jgi:hypothetical protein
VLDEPRYRQAAGRLADSLAAAPGSARAAELLEQLVHRDSQHAADIPRSELRLRRLEPMNGGRSSPRTVERNQL